MSSKKHRRRDKRRAEKVAEEAAEAFERANVLLAERLMLRALESGPANARFWKEFGEIELACEKTGSAERAFRRAILLSPGYRDALDALASVLAQGGRQQDEGTSLAPADDPSVPDAPPRFTERTERYDWTEIADSIVKRGLALVPALLGTEECHALRELFVCDELFEHDVRMDDDRGLVHYRFFRRPLPALLPELRSELYGRAAVIGNHMNELLKKPERFPLSHASFADLCQRAGQRRTSPILLRYPPGGFNAYHRDVFGSVFFPIQCAVSLGPVGQENGGDFSLLDQRPGKKQHEKSLATDAGDAVLFCTRERLCPIAGVYGLQPVLHGVSPVLGEERFALGLPFHDYAGD
jgi:hypothetical protein